jgi:Zn-dependent protease with chaperone function
MPHTYRYPYERLVLVLTILAMLGIIAVTAAATVCGSFFFILFFIFISFVGTRGQHQQLMQSASRVTVQNQPEVATIVRRGVARLQPGPVEVYLVRSSQRNAYTFGLSSPKVVVLYSALFETMDEDELLFIVGHELGHVALGHTWLNSLVGGMAGVPGSGLAGIVLAMAFLWWNRMCEYSADRAGMLACGKPEKAMTALLKLVAGPQANPEDLERVYQHLDAEDDTFLSSLGEAFGTHPMLIRRIQELRCYAASPEYRRLMTRFLPKSRIEV